jgi:hypothetical protein
MEASLIRGCADLQCDDHFWMSGTDSDAKVQQNKAVDGVRKAVAEEDGKVIVELNKTIGKLSDLVSAQQTQINEIHNSNIVTGKKPVSVIVENPPPATPPGEAPLDVHVSELPATPRLELGKTAMQYILTTNRMMNGGRAIFTCKGVIKSGIAQIAGAGATMYAGSGKIDDHTYTSGISSPNWSPDFPLIVTLYYDDAVIDPCTIKLPR